MTNYQNSLIKEHAQLVNRVRELHTYVYGPNSNTEDKIEFANKCIQLSAMKKYEEALRARLENANIVFENGNYFENLGSVEEHKHECKQVDKSKE